MRLTIETAHNEARSVHVLNDWVLGRD